MESSGQSGRRATGAERGQHDWRGTGGGPPKSAKGPIGSPGLPPDNGVAPFLQLGRKRGMEVSRGGGKGVRKRG